MAGIKHHTPAYVQLNDDGVDIGRIPKLSYNEEHDIDNASIAVAKLSDHTKAVHDALLIVPGDHATAHENGGGDELNVAGLSGELADAQPPKTHGNEVHSEEYITADDLPAPSSSGSGARGRDGAGFVNNMLTLWNPVNGEVPDGFRAVDSFGNFLVIEYIGGEQKDMNVTHTVWIVAPENVTIVILDWNHNYVTHDVSNVEATVPVTAPTDKPINIMVNNTTGSPFDCIIAAFDPETGVYLVDLVVTVADSTNPTFTVVLPKACNLSIGY